MTISNIAFARPGSGFPSPSKDAIFLAGYWGLRFGINFAFVIIWQVAAESYPTIARATGCSVVFSVGRLGAIAAPMLFERVTEVSGSHCLYYLLCSAICLMNCVF